MSLINVQNLTFSYDGGIENVFEDVCFQIDTDWKLGFVGRNGRGKTTFLKLLAGDYEYRGKITANVKFTYFPFPVQNKSRSAIEVLYDVCPDAEDWEIIRELSYLNTDAEILYNPFDTLSSGEQTKVLLAGLFLNDGNFLLIDEPTNHLDNQARQTVAQYLRRKKGFIIVSHDRAFLDGCVDHILSINRSDIEIENGNFSSWLENFDKKQAAEAARNEQLKREIGRLSEAAARTSGWADKTEASKYGKQDSGLKADRGFVGHKAAKIMKRAKVTEARQNKAIEQKRELLKNAETAEDLKLFPLDCRSERLLAFTDVQVRYGGRESCAPTSFEILRGERVALDGKNGCGKSSLLKMIMGEDIPHSGSLTLSSGLIISFVPQTAAHLTGSVSRFAEDSKLDEPLFRAILHKMGFGKRDFDTLLSEYSEGQKKKILIAKSLCEKAHLYVWDEPLNYLDIYSRMQIETLILSFCPTMIFVEHDKAFRESVATKTVSM